MEEGVGERERKKEKRDVQEASFRRHISMNCLISDTSFGMMGESSEESRFLFFSETSLTSRDFRFEKLDDLCGLWLK